MKRYYKIYSNNCLNNIYYIKKANWLEVLLDTSKSTISKIIYENKEYIVDYCGCQVYIPKKLGSYTAIIYGELPKEILQKELNNCTFKK